MLVLSRKEGEKICIGDNIVVTVTSLDGNKVSIGVEAPKDVMILRSELIKDTPNFPGQHEDNVA